MKEKFLMGLLFTLLAMPATQAFGQTEADEAADEYARIVQDAEAARAEAERARREAQRVAERAREASRARAELAREEAERSEARSEEFAKERAIREEEMERAREELSRAHRELREAQREVARAHRDLARDEAYRVTARVLNLGDKPVIGVVLGEETDEGVKLVGVSPDGPAEAAGIEAGDILTAINGKDLSSGKGDARATVFATMETMKPGDTVDVSVKRNDEVLSFSVVAEVREPASWQSLVRIPEIATVERIEGLPGNRRIVVESTVVPEIDEAALAERMEILKDRLNNTEIRIHGDPLHHVYSEEFGPHGDYEFELRNYSDFADHAFANANIWFGLPEAQGLKLAPVNEELGAYFKTERGVLVLEAKEENSYQLVPGDVILQVGASEVNSPSDLVRALREIEPGEEIEIEIKRDRRNRTLKVTMPENRFGFRME